MVSHNGQVSYCRRADKQDMDLQEVQVPQQEGSQVLQEVRLHAPEAEEKGAEGEEIGPLAFWNLLGLAPGIWNKKCGPILCGEWSGIFVNKNAGDEICPFLSFSKVFLSSQERKSFELTQPLKAQGPKPCAFDQALPPPREIIGGSQVFKISTHLKLPRGLVVEW